MDGARVGVPVGAVVGEPVGAEVGLALQKTTGSSLLQQPHRSPSCTGIPASSAAMSTHWLFKPSPPEKAQIARREPEVPH